MWTAQWFTCTTLALVVLTGLAALWAIPLSILAFYAAGFPLRRRCDSAPDLAHLFQE